jgi:hypothetical protein
MGASGASPRPDMKILSVILPACTSVLLASRPSRQPDTAVLVNALAPKPVARVITRYERHGEQSSRPPSSALTLPKEIAAKFPGGPGCRQHK